MARYIKLTLEDYLKKLHTNVYADVTCARRALARSFLSKADRVKGSKSIQDHFRLQTEPTGSAKKGVSSIKEVARRSTKAKALKVSEGAFLGTALGILRDESTSEKVFTLLDCALRKRITLQELHDILVSAA